jgi:hypothetical protein
MHGEDTFLAEKETNLELYEVENAYDYACSGSESYKFCL